MQALELTRLACDHNESALKDAAAARYSAKDIIGAVAKQLGNPPAVCKKSYVHPAVLSLGGQLASDPAGMQAVWKAISGRGTQGTNRLRAAEARLLAFLSSERRRAARAQRGSASTRRTASGSTVTA